MFWTKVSSNCSCGHVEGQFDVHARSFMQEYALFLIIVWNDWRKSTLVEFFSSNGSTGHVEPCFVNLAETFLNKGYVFLVQLAHLITITTSRKKIFNKCLFGHVEYSFDKPLKSFREKNPNFFIQCQTFWEVFFHLHYDNLNKKQIFLNYEDKKLLKFSS